MTLPRDAVALIDAALAEDLGAGDFTTLWTVPEERRARAEIVAKSLGVIAGSEVAAEVFRRVDAALRIEVIAPDGSAVAPGEVAMRVTGSARSILTAERTALNFLCHLSGVATATARWVDAVAGTGTRVRDTRKTTPGFRALEKYAVRCGGGLNHRATLSDMALVKDNHVLAAGGVVAAYDAVRRRYPDLPVQVEVTTLDQLRELLDVGAPEVLLDNMSTETMAEAVLLTGGRARLEASGGLTLERAREVAGTGVDLIAVGALTHSAPVLDVAMDLRP
jgi:nicotinate-nucleotide pyrophosphorylase (carboxylating)